MNLSYTPISQQESDILGLDKRTHSHPKERFELNIFGLRIWADTQYITDSCSWPKFIVTFFMWFGINLHHIASIPCFSHDILYTTKFLPRWKADLIMLFLAFKVKHGRTKAVFKYLWQLFKLLTITPVLAFIKYTGLLVGGWGAYNQVSGLDIYNRQHCGVERIKEKVKKDYADKPDNFFIHPKDEDVA